MDTSIDEYNAIIALLPSERGWRELEEATRTIPEHIQVLLWKPLISWYIEARPLSEQQLQRLETILSRLPDRFRQDCSGYASMRWPGWPLARHFGKAKKPFNKGDLKLIEASTQLRSLEVKGTDFVKHEAFLAQLSHITRIEVNHSSRVRELALTRPFPYVTTLRFTLTGLRTLAFLTCFPNLRVLEIDGGKKLEDARAIASLPQLEVLHLIDCDALAPRPDQARMSTRAEVLAYQQRLRP